MCHACSAPYHHYEGNWVISYWYNTLSIVLKTREADAYLFFHLSPPFLHNREHTTYPILHFLYSGDNARRVYRNSHFLSQLRSSGDFRWPPIFSGYSVVMKTLCIHHFRFLPVFASDRLLEVRLPREGTNSYLILRVINECHPQEFILWVPLPRCLSHMYCVTWIFPHLTR